MSAITLAAVGDIAFAGPLGADPMATVGRIAPGVRDLLKADIVLGDLEGPLSDVPPVGSSSLVLWSPPRSVEALKALGVSVVSLANNHILDCGREGLETTLRTLDAHGILHFGAGRNLAEATAPAIVTVSGVRVGFLGFNGGTVATSDRPGTLPIESAPTRRVVAEARARCDFLVGYFHEGIEAVNYPLRATIEACHEAVEAGANLVLGAHPHTIQGIEIYNETPIAYSVGNFIIPMAMPYYYETWRKQCGLARMGIDFDKKTILRALVLRCELSPGRKVEARGWPIFVDEDGLPRLPRTDEAAEAEAFLREISEAFDHPDAPCWRQRDEIEKGFYRLQRSELSMGFVLRNLNRLRWRHIVSFVKLLARS
jgi:hypothetical protein